MKYKLAEHISISVMNNYIFLFDEIYNKVYCITKKEEKTILLQIYRNLPKEIIVDKEDTLNRIAINLCEKGFLKKIRV